MIPHASCIRCNGSEREKRPGSSSGGEGMLRGRKSSRRQRKRGRPTPRRHWRAGRSDIPRSLPSRESRTREEQVIPRESSIRRDGSEREKRPQAVVVVVDVVVLVAGIVERADQLRKVDEARASRSLSSAAGWGVRCPAFAAFERILHTSVFSRHSLHTIPFRTLMASRGDLMISMTEENDSVYHDPRKLGPGLERSC